MMVPSNMPNEPNDFATRHPSKALTVKSLMLLTEDMNVPKKSECASECASAGVKSRLECDNYAKQAGSSPVKDEATFSRPALRCGEGKKNEKKPICFGVRYEG